VSLLRDFIELITTQPGALVYQLVTLFAIQLIAGVAVGHWQRERDEPATRLLITGLGLLAARASLMVVAVLHNVGLISPFAILPPLERFLNVVTSLLVIWAFLPALQDRSRLSLVLLLVLVLMAAGTYAAFAPMWRGVQTQTAAYNDHWQANVWELSTAVIVGLALIASLVDRGPDWGWLACLLLLWLGGHGMQLFASGSGSDYAGWVRLANLIGLPLLAGLTYRRALRAAAAPAVSPSNRGRGARGILQAVHRMSAEGNLEPAFALAARSVAQTLDADVAAVGLLFGGSAGELRVVARYPSAATGPSDDDPTLLLPDHPVLARAVASSELETITSTADGASAVEGVYRQLGYQATGPLLVQPLAYGEKSFGLILAGNPESKREWTHDEEELLQGIALALSPTIAVRRARREQPR
jgi:hypothetical protein